MHSNASLHRGSPDAALRAQPVRSVPEQRSIPLPQGMLWFAQRAARTSEPILLTGETGTGKTCFARLLHELGPRARGPFRSINCSAIPDPLFEREMFGHVRGAFTDARESREGLFEAADGGTLFLDEIGELSLQTQCKLLAVVEEGSVRRLGSTQNIPVDVRVIAATNADLPDLVRQKRFREDLFHRLAVLCFTIPPLRERRAEIAGIAERLLREAAFPDEPPEIGPDTMAILAAYPWPGNVRELRNALRHALVFYDGPTIEPLHLPEQVRHPPRSAAAPAAAAKPRPPARYAAPVDPDKERERILAALEEAGGNRARAARALGMSRCTLWVKLQRYGLAAD
jgi:DNA-binding NtrC family response regulator